MRNIAVIGRRSDGSRHRPDRRRPWHERHAFRRRFSPAAEAGKANIEKALVKLCWPRQDRSGRGRGPARAHLPCRRLCAFLRCRSDRRGRDRARGNQRTRSSRAQASCSPPMPSWRRTPRRSRSPAMANHFARIRPRFIGLHFFNPVPVMGLIEVIPGPCHRAGHHRPRYRLRARSGQGSGAEPG